MSQTKTKKGAVREVYFFSLRSKLSVTLRKMLCSRIDFDTPETPKTADKILKLLEPRLCRVRIVWMDNLCSGPELARQLNIEHSADCVGTSHIEQEDRSQGSGRKETKNRRVIFGSSHSAKIV